MDNDFTLIAVSIAVVIFAAGVFFKVYHDHRNGVRRY